MIEARKPVRRRVEIPRHGRYVVELSADAIRYREHGRRKWLTIPHGTALTRAGLLEADRIRAERKARRTK